MNTEEFIKSLTALVEEYVAGEEAYGDDAQLQLDTDTWQMEIAGPDCDLPQCDYYPMMDLVRMSADEPGAWQPDADAIADVAAEYPLEG